MKTAQVYGPDSRYLLVKASSGDLVQKVASDRNGFYLIVLHGHFICAGCTGPAPGAKPARGKVATEVWSPKTGQTDFGLGNHPVAASHLRGPTVVTLSASDSTRTDPTGHVSDLQFTYPGSYHLRRFTNCSFAVTGDRNGGCDRGVVIASYPLNAQPEIGGSGARFSAKGVAFELYRPPADNGAANVKLGDRRLSLWQFKAADDGLNLPGRKPLPPEQWGAWFRVNGASYWAIAWVGTNAQKVDRASLAALINSVHARGVISRAPSPKPAPQVTRILCGGTANSPRVPGDALVGGTGSGAYRICATGLRSHLSCLDATDRHATRGRPRAAPPASQELLRLHPPLPEPRPAGLLRAASKARSPGTSTAHLKTELASHQLVVHRNLRITPPEDAVQR